MGAPLSKRTAGDAPAGGGPHVHHPAQTSVLRQGAPGPELPGLSRRRHRTRYLIIFKLAAGRKPEVIADYLGVDSLAYLSVKGLLKACGGDQRRFCVGCFTDQYPIPLMDFSKKDVKPVC